MISSKSSTAADEDHQQGSKKKQHQLVTLKNNGVAGHSPLNHRLPKETRKLKPSEYRQERQMTLAGRLGQPCAHRPKIIELMGLNEKYQRNFQVPLDEPLFSAQPAEVVLQNFEADQTYEVTISFRNQDKFPRRIRLEPLQDTIFTVRGTKDDSLTSPKVAPGMEVSFVVRFCPRSDEDYAGDLVCVTEREKFILPLRATGSRALFDLPDEINFGKECPVRCENSKAMLVTNVGRKSSKFTVACTGSYFVKPEQGYLVSGQCMQLDVCFLPKKTGKHEGQLILTYETGENVAVKLIGHAEDVDIRLDKSNTRFDPTSITLSSSAVIRIVNRSNIMAKFKWKMFSTEEEENMYRRKHQQELEAEEETEKSRLKTESEQTGMSASNAIVEHRYKNLRKGIAHDPLLFDDDDSFIIEPNEGVVWPDSSIEVNVIFKPEYVGIHKKTIYCEISGRETRLPLRLKAEAFGPKAKLSYDVLEIQDVFIHTHHKYEMHIENIGGIDAHYSLIPLSSIFAPKFKFKPSSGVLSVGQSQTIRIEFTSDLLGEFSEEFLWELEGSPEPIPLLIRGKVIAPTFHFNHESIDFGKIPYGFTKKLELKIFNTSVVPLNYEIRIENPDIGPNELQISPRISTVSAKEAQSIFIEFTPMSSKLYETNLCIDAVGVTRDLVRIGFKAESVVPRLVNNTPFIEYGECFLFYPNTKSIEILNDSDYPARFTLDQQDESAKTVFSYSASEYSGIIEAHSLKKIDMIVDIRRVGPVSFPVFVKIAGNEDMPLAIDISATGVGPNVSFRPKELEWGKIPVLENKQLKIVMQNTSPIDANFNCQMESSPSVFSVQPMSGKISAQSSTNLIVTAFLDDTFQFSDVLKIAIKDGLTTEIKLSAKGFGTTIQLDQDVKALDFKTVFTGKPCEFRFVATNRGRRLQHMSWANSEQQAFATSRSTSTDPQSIFTILPAKCILKPGASQELVVHGMSNESNSVRERFECAVNFDRNPTKKLIFLSVVTANYIEPALRASPPYLSFTSRQDHDHAAIPISRDVILRNITDLTSTFVLKAPIPFFVTPDDREFKLDPEESLKCRITFDPQYLESRHSRKERAKLSVEFTDHPKQCFVDLIADVFYPNLKLSTNSIEFGHVSLGSENIYTLTLTNTSESEVYYSWSLVSNVGVDPTTNIPLQQIFDIFPSSGILGAKKSEEIQIFFMPSCSGNFETKIACNVQGGPVYDVQISGSVSNPKYEVIPLALDFGSRPFNEMITKKLSIKNDGQVYLPFKCLVKDDLPGCQHILVHPASGIAPPGEETHISVTFCAFTDSVEGLFYLCVGEKETIPIRFSGMGTMNLLQVEYPRPQTKEYNSILAKYRKLREKKLDLLLIQQTHPFVTGAEEPPLNESERSLVECESIRMEILSAVKRYNRGYKRKAFEAMPNSVGSALLAHTKTHVPSKKVIEKEGSNKIVHELDILQNNTFKCDFGNISPGKPYTINFTVKNPTDRQITFEVEDSKLKGTCFVVSPAGYRVIPSGQILALIVTCKPHEPGQVSADVPISVSNGPKILIQLRAAIFYPDVQMSMDHFDFGEVLVGNRKIIYVKITNNSPVSSEWLVKQENKTRLKPNRALSSADRRLPFEIDPPASVLEPKKSINVMIRFSPPTDDDFISDLRFVFGIKNYVFRATGKGLQVSLSCNPRQLTLGPVSPYGLMEGRFVISNPLNSYVDVFSYDFNEEIPEEESLKKPEASSAIPSFDYGSINDSCRRFIFTGPPQSGKTTQAKKFANLLKVPLISLSSLIEDGLKKESSGSRVQTAAENSDNITDSQQKSDHMSEFDALVFGGQANGFTESITNIIKTRLEESDCFHGFVIDGLDIPQIPSPIQLIYTIGKTLGPSQKVGIINLQLEVGHVREREAAKKVLEKKVIADAEKYLKSISETEYEHFNPREMEIYSKCLDIVKKRRLGDKSQKAGIIKPQAVDDRLMSAESKRNQFEEDKNSKRGKNRKSNTANSKARSTPKAGPTTPEKDTILANAQGKISKKSANDKTEEDSDVFKHSVISEDVEASQHLVDPLQSSFDAYMASFETVLNFMKEVAAYRVQAANNNASPETPEGKMPVIERRGTKLRGNSTVEPTPTSVSKDPLIVSAATEAATFLTPSTFVSASKNEKDVFDEIKVLTGQNIDDPRFSENLPEPYVEQRITTRTPLMPLKAIEKFTLVPTKMNENEDSESRPHSAAESINSMNGRDGKGIFKSFHTKNKSHCWTLRPKEKKEFILRFNSSNPGKIQNIFTFGVAGCSADFTLNVTAICRIPQMLSDVKKLFSKVRFSSTDDDAANGEFCVGNSTYNFGQLLAGRPRDKNAMDHKCSIPITNHLGGDLKVYFYLRNDIKGDVFLAEPSHLDVPANTTQYVDIWALPKSQGKFEDYVLCCIKDNPQPYMFRVKCHAVQPTLELETKMLHFERVLLNRPETRKFKIKNPTALNLSWRIVAQEGSGDEFAISPTEGILAGKAETTVEIKFCCAKPLVAKRSLRLEVSDIDKSQQPYLVDTINLTAESYDVAVDLHFPKGGDNGLDFGTLRVNEESRQTCVLRNKGKFDVSFKFELDSVPWAHSLTILPSQGILAPGEKPITVQMILKCDTEVNCSNSMALSCNITEPVNNESIGAVPVKVNFRSTFSKFAIQPQNDLNFGPLLMGTKTSRTFYIENTGDFDFVFNIAKYEMPDREDAAQKGPKSKGNQDIGAMRARRDQGNSIVLEPFTVYPITGTVVSGAKQSITVDYFADTVSRYEEYIEIDFSDRPPGNKSVIYRLAGECLLPGLNNAQKINIFDEIGVVKSLASYTGFLPVYGEEDDVFTFNAVLIGQQATAKFKIFNSFKIPCDVSMSVKMKLRGGIAKPGEAIECPFDVEPKRLQIPANDFRYVTCTFLPSSIQQYISQFEANVEGVLSDPKHKSLSFEVRGEGTLPRVAVDKPQLKSKTGVPLLKFKRLTLGQATCLPIVLRNEGVIPAVVKLEWNSREGNEFQFKASDGVVHIKPQESQEIEVQFEPSAIKKFESEIKVLVSDNTFEDTSILLQGEGHQDDVTFDGLPNDSDDQANFGECVVGETKHQLFQAVNNTGENLRLAWMNTNDITFRPPIGHIKPKASADFMVFFTAKSPGEIQQQKVACKVTKVRYPYVFDDRRPKTPRVKDDDPPHEVLANSPDQALFVSALVDYASYECDQKEIIFKRTLMYQSRTFQFSLKNTGRVRWSYNFVFYDVDGGLVQYDEGPEKMPFSVQPVKGSINSGESVQITVKFAPLESDEYQFTLVGSIDGLPSGAKQISIPIAGSSIRPLCHFDLPESTYITVRRNPELFPEISYRLTPNTRVIEFNCIGVLNRFVKKFDLINPSSISYEFNWDCLIQDSETPAFKCVTQSGIVQSGKKFEIIFEFVSNSSKTTETLWNFSIPSQNVNVQFLLVGTVTEPNLLLDKTSLNFKSVLIGHRAKETVLLINTENVPFNFNFEHQDEHDEKTPLQIVPSVGTVPANGKMAVDFTFIPSNEIMLNRTIVCNVRKKSIPLSITVKGEAYKIRERVTGELTDGSVFELVPGINAENILDFGHLMVNEKKSKRVVLSNLGKYAFEYTWSIQGSQNDLISVDCICGTIAKGESKSVELFFNPFRKVLLKDVIAVCQITNGNTYKMRFTGVGRSPRVLLSSDTCNFGTSFIHRPGTDPDQMSVQITNKDSRDLLLDLINPNTHQQVFDVTLEKTVLAPGDSTKICAKFFPKEAREYHETTAIEINGLSKIYLKLIGVGAKFNVETVLPELRYVDFGTVPVGEKANQIVRIINQSCLTAHFYIGPRDVIEKLKTRGVHIIAQSDYKLSPKGVASIEIKFNPVIKQFLFSETIQVISHCGSQSLLTISGSAPSKEIKLENDQINFGTISQYSSMTKCVSLSNVGDTPARFHWHPSQFLPDFDISPHEGFLAPGSTLPLEITCTPQKVNSNIHYQRLKCEIENMNPLFLTLNANCVPIPQASETLKFQVAVREVEKKTIAITNRSGSTWHINPIFDNDLWKGAEILEVEPGQSKNYDIFYHPMVTVSEENKNEGSVYFPFPDGIGLVYKLVGYTAEPNCEATITKDVPSKQKHVETLKIKNWLAKPQRFKVIFDIQKADSGTTAHGHDFIDVPGRQSKEYKVTFFAYKEGSSHVKVTFQNETTKEYLYYNLNYKSSAPASLETHAITTQVRQPGGKVITVDNPLPQAVTLTTSCPNTEIIVPHTFTIPAKSTGELTIEFLPLFPKETVSRLSLHSSELGTYHYDLKLLATQAAQERSVHFRTALGSSVTQTVRLLNYCRAKCEFTCRIENPDFFVEKPPVAIPAGNGVTSTEFLVEVTFEPSKVGDIHSSLIVTSPNGGDYYVPLFGQCFTPKPQGPIIVKLGATSTVSFKNVFNSPATFNFNVDNPSFSVKNSEQILPKKIYQIQIQFKPLTPKASKTGKLTVVHPNGTTWVYYMKAVENQNQK